ncbi:MAG TPA: hypothetical protein DCY20_07635 [Firmicutes bacterium]|nr:hypothetical protein [Bacillota bacterium]
MQINENEIKDIINFHCPRFSELPKISLYKDQVILYIEEVLKPLNVDPTEKLLTSTMINNYVKQKVVSPPLNRRYNEKHIAYLIIVCLLKQVYSLTEICEMINTQIDTYPTEKAYDFFCLEFERALKIVFSTREDIEPNSASKMTLETELARSTAYSVAHKIFVQKYLMYKRNSEVKK